MLNKLLASGLSLALTLLVSSSVFAQTPETKYDRPDYQAFDTPQNIYENQQAWLTYTNELDSEWLGTDALDYAIQVIGENFSATQEFLILMDAGAFPTGACAQEFHVAVYSVVQYYALFYGAMYFNLTATVGEPIDAEAIINEVAVAEEYFYGEYITPECYDKLNA